MRFGSLLAVMAVALGCGSSSPVGAIRFAKTPPVWRVDDRTPVSAAPSARDFYRALYKFDGAIARRATRAMELRPHKPVLDVNSLDEVPDSTWFVNRIGVREMTIEELKRGPNVSESPFDHRPWTITGAKVGGKSLGFTFEDTLKRKFLLKFDEKAFPELETGAHIIVHRLLWAIGYNVPEDHLGNVRRSDLVIGEKAKKKGFDEKKLDDALKLVYHRPDGSIRVLASLFVPGTPVGPYAREGTRSDDPNDLIRHELRRSLRGQYAIFAWLDHTDMKEDNTLDTYEHGYVTHYLIDFGKALGVMGRAGADASNGHRYLYDLKDAALDLFGFGLRTHPWEGIEQVPITGVGLYDAEHFDPASWRSMLPYWPLLDKDRFDAFWGAKLLMRFKPHELAAIVEEAKFTDPRASKYLVDTLLHRQRMTGRYWFDRVAPLDSFTVEAPDGRPKLCFTDLTLAYLLRTSPTTYAIDTFKENGDEAGFSTTIPAGPKGRTCTAIPAAPGKDGYTIVRLRVRRDQREMPPVVVHLAKVKGNYLDVVGLRRR
jgi:hypothetical protein